MTKEKSKQFARACHKALVEFGYDDLTVDFVEKELDKLLKGKKPKNVIGMFMESWVKEHDPRN